MEDETLLPCEGKIGFSSRKEAQAAAIVAAHQYGSKLQVYECQHCQLWHLSSVFA